VSGWDVSNVVYGYSVFAGCSSLTELDLSNWDISKFNSLREMFNDCTNLRNVFMLNWNSSNCTSTYRAFYNCKNITLLDFSNWDFKLVTSMNGMINGCTSLETIIFNNIDLRNVDVTYPLSTSSLPLLKNIIVKNSTAANINKLIEILPHGNSAINCKIYLPLTQDMSNINVAAANAKGWKVTQGGIVYNVSKVLIEDTVVFEYDGISEGRSTCFAPTFGASCGVKIADVTEEETAMYMEAVQKNGCIITYDTGDGVIIEEITHEVSSFIEGTTGILTNNSNLVLMFSPKAWSWYYAHVDQYVNDPGVYIIQNQLNNDEGYAHNKFRCLKVEILGLKSTKIARLKRGEFINDTIKKTVVGEVPNITYK
jgi:surface protein